MRPIDIINVAGLLMDGKKDGIEKELREKGVPRFMRTIAPTPIGSVMENPLHAVERAVLMIREAVQDIAQQFGESNIVLVGRSYGAFIALLAAIKLNFQKISKVILIEGPLHPDVTVTPPNLLPPLMACGIHYKMRPTLAREAVDRLRELGTAPIVVVQGGKEDGVVPTLEQVIPGDFETIELNGNFPKRSTRNAARGIIMKLPPHMGGRTGGIKKIIPDAYRNHLYWSGEKMEMIRRIIEDAGLSDAEVG